MGSTASSDTLCSTDTACLCSHWPPSFPVAKRPRKTKAVSNATVEDPTDNAQADIPAHEEDNAGGVHQEDPAGDAHEEEGAGGDHPASDQEDGHGRGEFEFDHGLTLDQNEKYY